MDRAARLTTRSTATLTQRNVARRRMGRPNMRKRFTDNARAALPLTCHCGDVATHTNIWGATCDEHTFHGHDDSRVRLAPRLLGLGFEPSRPSTTPGVKRWRPVIWLTLAAEGHRSTSDFLPVISRIDWWYERTYSAGVKSRLHDHCQLSSVLTSGVWHRPTGTDW